MQEDKLKKLKSLLALANDGLTRKEFLESFKKVVEQVYRIESKTIQKVNKAINDLKSDNEIIKNTTKDDLNKLVIQFEKIIKGVLKEQENGMNFIKDKVRRIKEGKDGKDGHDGQPGRDGKSVDEDKIIQQVLDKLEIPEPDLGAIDELKTKVEQLEQMPKKGGGGFSYIALKGAGGLTGTGTSHVTVSASEPSNPAVGDLWVDIS